MDKKKSKMIGMVLGVVLFMALVAGVTYAWISWTSQNVIIAGSTECFDVDYTITNQIGTALEPAKLRYLSSYVGGQYAEVALSVNDNCSTINGTGTLYLTTDSTATSATILDGGLYYTVVKIESGVSTVLSQAPITSTSEITLLNNIPVTNATDNILYRVYVWINGEYAGNTYLDTVYVGSVRAEVLSNETSLSS